MIIIRKIIEKQNYYAKKELPCKTLKQRTYMIFKNMYVTKLPRDEFLYIQAENLMSPYPYIVML